VAGDGLAGWPAESAKLLGASNSDRLQLPRRPVEVSGGCRQLAALVFDTPRATWIGGGYVSLRNEGWEFIVAPEARDSQGVPLAHAVPPQGRHGPPRRPARSIRGSAAC